MKILLLNVKIVTLYKETNSLEDGEEGGVGEGDSNWENTSSVADNDDILVVDEDFLNEMDKSYDEEGNEIHYDDDL